jgi:hypothetical protein
MTEIYELRLYERERDGVVYQSLHSTRSAASEEFRKQCDRYKNLTAHLDCGVLYQLRLNGKTHEFKVMDMFKLVPSY